MIMLNLFQKISFHWYKARQLNKILMYRLAGVHRTTMLNQILGIIMAGIAGMINGGGYLLLKQYTSHMTGTITQIPVMLFLEQWHLVLRGAAVCLFFVLGSAVAVILVIIGKHYKLSGRYAFPLIFEGILLVVFSFLGFIGYYNVENILFPLMFLLSFVMGLQNSVITDLSDSQVRTTHVTGTVTDIGMGIGRWFVHLNRYLRPISNFNYSRLRFNVLLVTAFFTGSSTGAWGFGAYGFYFCFLPVALLIWLCYVPISKDLGMRRSAYTSSMASSSS